MKSKKLKSNDYKLLRGRFLYHIRQTPPYLRWREKVHSEQGKRCIYCGSAKSVNVHHIVPLGRLFTRFLDKYGSDYILTSDYEFVDELLAGCEEFWDTNNGIVLCEICHQFEHPDRILNIKDDEDKSGNIRRVK